MGVVSEIIGGPESRLAWGRDQLKPNNELTKDARHPLFYRNRNISCPNMYLMSMERTVEVFGGGFISRD